MYTSYPHLYTRFFLMVIIICLSFRNADAQSITIVPKPAAGFEFGGEIPYNNTFATGLFVRKNLTLNGHIGVWNGSGLTLVSNPTNDLGIGGPFGVTGIGLVYNNTICAGYINAASKYQLSFYDGVQWTLVNNPDGGIGYYNSFVKIPVIYNGKIYIPYIRTDGLTKMAVFDGTTLQLVTAPDSLITYEGKPIVYNNKLYSAWITQDSVSHLVEYDGTSFRIIPNPSNTPFTGVADESLIRNNLFYPRYPDPVVYHDKLYYPYSINTANTVALSQFDNTTGTLSLIANPDNSPVGVYLTNFAAYNNRLYLDYADSTSNPFLYHFKLGEFDGSKLSIVPSAESSVIDPSATLFTPYNGRLYFVNNPGGGAIRQLYSYDSATTTIQSIPNYDATGSVQATLPVVYNNKLWFGYQPGGSSRVNPAQYDGQKTTLISNPDNGAGYLNYFLSFNYPFVYSDTLFFPYETDTAGLAGANLAYLHDFVLGISLSKFTAQPAGRDVVLQWQTASETNAGYFSILRSIDGLHFTAISNVQATGNSTVTKAYSYTDNGAASLNVSKLYYRLQDVDKDGKSTYSDVKTVVLSNTHSPFTISPNPAKSFINIVSSENVAGAFIKITDLSGKTVFQKAQDLVAGQPYRISASQFPGGILVITITSNSYYGQFKIVKE